MVTETIVPLPSRPAGIMFHHFHGEGYPASQGSISASDLARMLDQIGTNRILPALEWQKRAVTGALQPGDLCLTFDDNLQCQYKVALPVLREFDLTAFFFVYTSVNQGVAERLEIYRHFRTVAFSSIDDFYKAFFDFLAAGQEAELVSGALKKFDPDYYLADYAYLTGPDKTFRYIRDRILGRARYEDVMDRMLVTYNFDIQFLLDTLWMTDRNLLELHKEGHVVGLHSHSHPTVLADLSVEDQKREFVSNLSHLRGVLGAPILSMSHPNNSYNKETLDILHDIGILVGFRANMSSPSNATMELPRHNHSMLQRAIQGIYR